jgi:hypothetical protein
MVDYIQVTTLEDVKIGDKFVIKKESFVSTRLELVTCKSITPKQAVIGGGKYRKEDASGVGRGNPYLYQATDELIDEIIKVHRRDFVKMEDYTKIDDKKIEEIYKILTQKEEVNHD